VAFCLPENIPKIIYLWPCIGRSIRYRYECAAGKSTSTGDTTMTIQQAADRAAEYLAAVSAAVDIEIQVVTSAGHTMYAIFDRNGLVDASLAPRICD